MTETDRGCGAHRAARLLEPRSVAIVGASPGAGGSQIISNLVSYGFEGDIHPVNPKYDLVAGFKCHPTVRDIGGSVDVVAIRVPADRVAGVLRDCTELGIGGAIIFAAGFGEDAGGRGSERELEIRTILEDGDLVVSGPNTLGYFNVLSRTALTSSPALVPSVIRRDARWIPDSDDELWAAARGNIALVGHSGGLVFSMFSRGLAQGMGFSHVVSLGNETDFDALECVEYLCTLREVKVIAMFVEGFRRPEQLWTVAAAAEAAGKALVIGKGGESEAGRAAALSHTGHLAGQTLVHDAVFRRLGIVQVHDQEEMIDVCWALATNEPIAGNAVAVATQSGGSAVWTADALERAGFQLPNIDAGRQEELKALLPPFASVRNPIDGTGASQVGLATVMRVIGDAPYLDALVLIPTLGSSFGLAGEQGDLDALVKEVRKPILAYSYTEPTPDARRIYRALGIPVYSSSTRCARALRALYTLGAGAARTAEKRAIVERMPIDQWPQPDPLGVLTESQSSGLLAAAGFPVARQFLATSANEAAHAAAKIEGPVAMKLQAPGLMHKGVAGGVVLCVLGDQDVRASFDHLCQNVGSSLSDVHGVLIQEMVTTGLEMIAGIDNTTGFGPILVVGFGGSRVEQVRDICMVCAPVSEEEAFDVITSLRNGALLRSEVQGAHTYDLQALVRLLVRLSWWAVTNEDRIRELDLNPVVVQEHGIVIVDSLIVMNRAVNQERESHSTERSI